jgi:hypothetical protein
MHALLPVECPISKHIVGEYYAPAASGVFRYVCRRCQPKRYVLLTLRDGRPEVRTELYHGD